MAHHHTLLPETCRPAALDLDLLADLQARYDKAVNSGILTNRLRD